MNDKRLLAVAIGAALGVIPLWAQAGVTVGGMAQVEIGGKPRMPPAHYPQGDHCRQHLRPLRISARRGPGGGLKGRFAR